MALSGPDALKSIEEAVRDIRREEDEIAKRLSRSAERITKFAETEGQLFRQLASIRLDPATQADLSGRLSQTELKARDMLKQHAERVSSTEQALKALDAEIASLNSARAEASAEIDRRQAELKALSSRIAAAVAKDPAYEQKRREADELAGIAAESLRKTEQAETDREQKGRPYRDDPLFSYLWARGYGTKNYAANNLVRYLDGLVAGITGYNKARPNFAMLNEIPMRLREHAERQQANADAAEQEVDAQELAAIDAAGGQPMREALGSAQARVEEIDARIVVLEDQRDESAKTLRQLAQGGDPAFDQAIAALAEGLGREDLQALLAEARRTQTAQDDTIIAQIDDARARMREEDSETAEHKERLKTLATRRRELEDIEWEFKKQRFDDPRSTFREDRLVGDMLNDFLRGAVTAGAYWEQWQRSQNWRPGTTDWGGGVGLPRSGRRQEQTSPWSGGGGFQWPDASIGGSGGTNRRPPSPGNIGGNWGRLPGGGNSGGFSRPRTGNSGSRKGGGFKTGGGF